MSRLQPNSVYAENYRLIEMIGKGGFSEVWKAKYEKADVTVAIKIYAPYGGIDGDGVKVFRDEYRKVINLNHGNLLRASHFDIYRGSPFLVLPFCAGGTAQQKIGKMDEGQLVQLLYQLSCGLEYLHENKVFHHDIKPNNILFDEKGTAMLADFGISSKLRETFTLHATSQYETLKLQEQQSMGTTPPAYRAPEFFDSNLSAREPNSKQDIFSLGVTMFQIASSNLPFHEFGGMLLLKGSKIPYLPSPFSVEFSKIIGRMLALNPLDRPSASSLKELTGYYLDNRGWPNRPRIFCRLGNSFFSKKNITFFCIFVTLLGAWYWFRVSEAQTLGISNPIGISIDSNTVKEPNQSLKYKEPNEKDQPKVSLPLQNVPVQYESKKNRKNNLETEVIKEEKYKRDQYSRRCFMVVVGSFREKSNADKLIIDLKSKGFYEAEPILFNQEFWYATAFQTMDERKAYLEVRRAKEQGYSDAFVKSFIKAKE